MRSLRVVTVIAALVFLGVVSAGVFAQDTTDKAVTVTGILEKAECPLSEEKAKQYKAIDLSEGREVFRSLYELFDDTQMDALKAALGVREGRDDRPDRPRYLMQVVVFEKAECPLTEKQLEALKKLSNERGSWEQAREIYTEEQNEEFGKIFQRRSR